MKCVIKNLILFLTLVLSSQAAFCYTLTYQELNKTIEEKIKKQTNFDDFSLKISGIPYEKIITNDLHAPKVEILSQNQQNQAFQPYSFKKVIIKDNAGKIIKTFSINVQTLVYKNVLVAKNQIPFSGEINSTNSKLERKEISRFLSKTYSTMPNNAIATRNYPAGSIILTTGTKQKAAVLKNSQIDIVFLSQKGLKITVQGHALKDGAVGETILVKSDKYNKTYNATVNSSKEVTVRI